MEKAKVFSTAIVLLIADGPDRFPGLILLGKRLQKWAICSQHQEMLNIAVMLVKVVAEGSPRFSEIYLL